MCKHTHACTNAHVRTKAYKHHQNNTMDWSSKITDATTKVTKKQKTTDTDHSHTGWGAALGTGWTSSCECHWGVWTRAATPDAGGVPTSFDAQQGRGQGVPPEAEHPVISQMEWRRQTCNNHHNNHFIITTIILGVSRNTGGLVEIVPIDRVNL